MRPERRTRVSHGFASTTLGTTPAGGTGTSRVDVHFEPVHGRRLIRPAGPEPGQRPDPLRRLVPQRSRKTQASAAMPTASGVRPLASTTSARRWVSTSGMLIRTGHTS